ncbi:hypothetical protein ACN9M0_38765 [Streptomyces sp. R-07]|uniref:hypothetical protein n=1 Tax=Streptomyces sp. R-07 TaxID=3404052 RepID=UPI003CE940E9
MRREPPGLGPAGPARRADRADPRRPRAAIAEAATGLRPQGRPTAQARSGVPLRHTGNLARPRGHHELRQGRHTGVGPSPPAAHPLGCPAGHKGELPLIEGILIRPEVEHLSKDSEAPAVWLWSSRTGSNHAGVDRAWQAFLRRFDLEHTFRLFKQTLGWTEPRLREPEAADRWTWLIIAAYPQLRLGRPPARDLRHPWEKPAAPRRLTPARVRRTFRDLRQHMPCPARAPKPHRPGPGRPVGSRNTRRAPRYDVGKTVRREKTHIALQRLKGQRSG